MPPGEGGHKVLSSFASRQILPLSRSKMARAEKKSARARERGRGGGGEERERNREGGREVHYIYLGCISGGAWIPKPVSGLAVT